MSSYFAAASSPPFIPAVGDSVSSAASRPVTDLVSMRQVRNRTDQRFGLRSGSGMPIPISARSAAGSSRGSGGPASLLASTLGAAVAVLASLISGGSERPAVSTVLHWAGNSAIVRRPLRLNGLAGYGGRFAAAIAAFFSLAYQPATSSSQPSPLPTAL